MNDEEDIKLVCADCQTTYLFDGHPDEVHPDPNERICDDCAERWMEFYISGRHRIVH